MSFSNIINPFKQDVSVVYLGNTEVWRAVPPAPSVSTTAKSGVTYSTDLSSLTANDIHEISKAISNEATITNTTTAVYVDWGQMHIKLSCENGTYSTKNIAINGSTADFVILGFNHDTLTDSNFYGEATATGKAGISWQTKNCLNLYANINSSASSVGGWSASKMRLTTMTNLYNGFGLKDIVAPVNKLTSAGNRSSSISTDSDRLFLLSVIEVLASTGSSYAGEGTQYSWYRAGNTKVKKVGNTNDVWWTRSPYTTDAQFWNNIGESGSNGFYYASFSSYAVAPAFCT